MSAPLRVAANLANHCFYSTVSRDAKRSAFALPAITTVCRSFGKPYHVQHVEQ